MIGLIKQDPATGLEPISVLFYICGTLIYTLQIFCNIAMVNFR